jgi:hypothetical protein
LLLLLLLLLLWLLGVCRLIHIHRVALPSCCCRLAAAATCCRPPHRSGLWRCQRGLQRATERGRQRRAQLLV